VNIYETDVLALILLAISLMIGFGSLSSFSVSAGSGGINGFVKKADQDSVEFSLKKRNQMILSAALFALSVILFVFFRNGDVVFTL
jgi:hypothetical protein